MRISPLLITLALLMPMANAAFYSDDVIAPTNTARFLGYYVGSAGTGNYLSTSSTGTTSTPIYIGDEKILTSGDTISAAGGWTDGGTLVSLTTATDNVSAGNLFIDNSNGRVGIGTTAPGYLLQVDGTVQFGTTAGAIVRMQGKSGTSQPGQLRRDLIAGLSFREDSGNLNVNFMDSGKVGIGTTGPERKLHVQASDTNIASFEGDNDGLTIQGNAAGMVELIGYKDSDNTYNDIYIRGGGGTGIFLNQSSGNVGIGTTAPAGKLSVINGADDTIVLVGEAQSGGVYGLHKWWFDENYYEITTGGGAIPLVLQNAGGGNVGIGTVNPAYPLTINKAVSGGTLSSGGNWNVAVSDGYGAFGTQSTTNAAVFGHMGTNGSILFAGWNGNTNTERMRIDGTGNVGIGTTAPLSRLGVLGGITFGTYSHGTFSRASTLDVNLFGGSVESELKLQDLGSGYNPVINVYGQSDTLVAAGHNSGASPQINLWNDGATDYSIFRAGTIYGSTASAGDLTIDSTIHATKGDIILNPTSGNVGIRTTGPAYELDVSGDARITGAVITPGGILGNAGGGAADVPIWAVGETYNNYGIFYNEGTPDLIEFKAAGVVTSSIALDNGAITGATINTGSGAMELGDAAIINGDTNSIPTNDQVYDFVIGQNYLTTSPFGASIDDTELTAEDFGDFTCTGLEDGCTIDTNAVALGTDTTGNYVGSVSGGTAITVSGTAGEGWTPSVAVTADSIGDTQLAFNTGQHLTTTSSPTFVDLNSISYINGDFGTIARSTDEWLRLNQNSGGAADHTNGIYSPGGLRADGGLAAGGYSLVAGEIRANIFRDADSGYYLDPANTGTSANLAGSLTAAGDLTASNLFLSDYTRTSYSNVNTYENVAQYHNGNAITTGTIIITIGSTPNMMIDADVIVQGYNGLRKYQVRGYTYTGSTNWHQPVASCVGSGVGSCSVRFGKVTATGERVIMLGTTGTNWGSYPHVAVTRVTRGYPSSGDIGTWSISMVTDESTYTVGTTPNINDGFQAYNTQLSGTTSLSGSLDMNNNAILDINWAGSDDGTGSDLDADLLDGQHGTYYQPASTALTTSTSWGGDLTGTGSSPTIAANAVALTTDTTGNYVGSVSGGTAITISGTAGEGWTPSVAVTADSIGDTQLAYDTGQHLTTSSTPAFSTVQASNFRDGTGAYNVNLGSGGSEGRGLVAGYSGGSYGGIGYNIRHTGTGATYIAPGGDTVSYLLFNGGGFQFQGSPAGAAGRTPSMSTLMTLSAAGALTTTSNLDVQGTSINLGSDTKFSQSGNWIYLYNDANAYGSKGLAADNIWVNNVLQGPSSIVTVSGQINTGPGATEVHLMNQNVQTTDSPTFVDLNSIRYIYGDYGTMIQSTDEWLRLNGDSTHTSGTYSPLGLRADGGLAAGGYALAAGEVRGTLFRDGTSGYYADPASTSILSVVRSNTYQDSAGTGRVSFASGNVVVTVG